MPRQSKLTEIWKKAGIFYVRRVYGEQVKKGHLSGSSDMTTVKTSRVAGWLLYWVIIFVGCFLDL
jgi:hypothetical protein